jgi:galactokinase
VTPAWIADALIASGMDQRERSGKQELFRDVLERHAAMGRGAPLHLWWIPGRLEVLGKHTDYAGGRTLICAVPRGFAVAASPRADAVVRVSDARRGDELTVRPADIAVSHAGWRRYAEVTVRRMARNFPGAPLGADIAIASDLPSASGMSSSSALIIAVAVALGRVAGIKHHSAWTANIHTGLDAAGYYACIENGRSFGALEGDGGVGTHGGSEDHTAIIEGRAGHVSAFSFVPARAIASARVPDEWRFVIARSGVAARKTGEARLPYNRLSAGVSRLLEMWNEHRPADAGNRVSPGSRLRSLAEALRSHGASQEDLRDVCARGATADMPAEWLRARLDHFIREDARIECGLAAFASADAAAIGALAADSQYDAEALLRNQVPETSALASAARALGAMAACSFGAGFGGAVWALAQTQEADAFAQRWHPSAFVMSPGPAVTEIPSWKHSSEI